MKFVLLLLYTGLTFGVRKSHLENLSGNKRHISDVEQHGIELQLSSMTENVINIFLRRLQEFVPILELEPRLREYFNSAQCKSIYEFEKRVGLIESEYIESVEEITGRDSIHEEEITSEHFMSELKVIPLPKFALRRIKNDVDRLFTLLSTRKGVKTNEKLYKFNRRWKNLINNLKSRQNPSRAYQELRKRLRKYLKEADKFLKTLELNSLKKTQAPKAPTQQQIRIRKQQQKKKIVRKPASSTERSVELVLYFDEPSKIQVKPIDESANTDDSDKRYNFEKISNKNETQNTDIVEPSFMSVVEIPNKNETQNTDIVEPSFISVVEIPNKNETQNTDIAEPSFMSVVKIPNKNETQNTDIVEPSFMSVMEIIKSLMKVTLNLHVPTDELNRVFSYLRNKYKSPGNTNPDEDIFANTVIKTITNTDKNIVVKASTIESSSTNSITNIIKNSTINRENDTNIRNSSQFSLFPSQQKLPLKEQEKEQEQEEAAVTEPASSTVSYIELLESTLPSHTFTTVDYTAKYPDELVIPQNIEHAGTSYQILGTATEQATNADDSKRKSGSEKISIPSESQNTDYTETLFASVMKSITDLLRFNLNLNVPTNELTRIFSNLPFKYKIQGNTTTTDSVCNNTAIKTIIDTNTNTNILTSSSTNINSNGNINPNSIFSKENSTINLKILQLPIAQKQQETAAIKQQHEETNGTNQTSSTSSSVELLESMLPSQNLTTVHNASTIEDVLDVLHNLTDLLNNYNSSEALLVEEESYNNEDSEHIEIQNEIQVTDLEEKSNTDDSDRKSVSAQTRTSNETQSTYYAEPLFTSLIENIHDMLKVNLSLSVSETELKRIFRYLQYKYKNCGNATTDANVYTNTSTKNITRTNTGLSTNMSINSTFNEENVPVIQNISQSLTNTNLLNKIILNDQKKQFPQMGSEPDFQETLQEENPNITLASFLPSSESNGIKKLLSSLSLLDQEYQLLHNQKLEKLKTSPDNKEDPKTKVSRNLQIRKVNDKLQTTQSNNMKNNMRIVKKSRKNSSATLQISEDKGNSFQFIDLPSTFAERYKLTEVKHFEKYDKNEVLKGRAVDSREPTMEMGNFALTGFNNYQISGIRIRKKSSTIYETIYGDARRMQLINVEVDQLRSKNIEMIPQCFKNDYLGNLKYTDLVENSVNSMKFERYFTKILREILQENKSN